MFNVISSESLQWHKEYNEFIVILDSSSLWNVRDQEFHIISKVYSYYTDANNSDWLMLYFIVFSDQSQL